MGFKIDPQDIRRKQYTYTFANIVQYRRMILHDIDIQLAQQKYPFGGISIVHCGVGVSGALGKEGDILFSPIPLSPSVIESSHYIF